MSIKKMLILIVMLGLSFSASAAYIRSYRASLYENPTYQSKELTTVSKGEKVQELETSGNWTKITVNGVTGWIARMSLSNDATESRVIIPKSRPENSLDQKQQPNLRLRVARAAVGVKGLRESQVTRIEQNLSDWEALEKMESFAEADEAASKFVVGYRE